MCVILSRTTVLEATFSTELVTLFARLFSYSKNNSALWWCNGALRHSGCDSKLSGCCLIMKTISAYCRETQILKIDLQIDYGLHCRKPSTYLCI